MILTHLVAGLRFIHGLIQWLKIDPSSFSQPKDKWKRMIQHDGQLHAELIEPYHHVLIFVLIERALPCIFNTSHHSSTPTVSDEYHFQRPALRVFMRMNHIQRDHHRRDRFIFYQTLPCYR